MEKKTYENKKETSRLTEENISYEKEQKLLQRALEEITIQMEDISGKLEELKQQRSTAMKKQNQIFQADIFEELLLPVQSVLLRQTV